MPLEDYKLGEVTELAKVIYQEKIKHLVEPAENGKYIVIDVESGDYEIDEDHITASDRLRARRPNAATYAGRVGYPTTYDLRGRIRLEGSSMPFEGYQLGEVTELAKVIYQEKIKHLVEPAENGKFIVIDVESGDYEIDEELIPASDRLYARRPNAAAYGGRVGYPTTYVLSGSIRVIQ